jgi:hypothetical protein
MPNITLTATNQRAVGQARGSQSIAAGERVKKSSIDNKPSTIIMIKHLQDVKLNAHVF